jgi:1A family penicillin-binding protein
MSTYQLKGSNFWRHKSNGDDFKKHKKNPILNWLWHQRRRILAVILIFIAVASIAGLITVLVVSRNLPNPNQLLTRDIAQTTKIYDRTGQHVLYEISGDQKRTLVTLDQIPIYTQKATIAIEDKNFYNHGGFSLWSIFRTAITDVLFNRSAGGSTLTQQFVKNAILTSEKSFTRKIKEVILSEQIEKKFTKDQILQMYLNEIPYGSNAYGVEAASQKYFGKSVQNIDLAESAVLAAMIQSPSYYSPYGSNLNDLLARKNYVLDLMAEQGYINNTQRDQAKNEVLNFKKPETSIFAPHFIMYVKELLAEKYGEKTMEQGGLKVYTTLDYDKQQIAEKVVAEKTIDYPTKYKADNASLVAIDPKTGQILAMVGSRDYFNNTIDGQVNVATSLRQPGSSMKPIVYSALFEKGYSTSTILYDVVTNFSTDPSHPYIPKNYNLKEYGPVTIRQALAGSLNIPAVKALYLAGLDNVVALAKNMGYTSLNNSSRFGLTFVLGGAEVELLQHVNAYSAFARDGQVCTPYAILKVVDKNGNVLEDNQPQSKQVITSKTARLINSILTDNSARSFMFGVNNYLTLGSRPVGAKTGTTNDFRDAWTIGYTPSLVAGVWVGNTDDSMMRGGSDGSIVAAPIWNSFMKEALGNSPIETFKAPETSPTGKNVIDGILPVLGTIKVDKRTGMQANKNTPAAFLQDKTIYDNHCILYYVNKDNPLGPVPTDPTVDPQFNLWESAVQDWAKRTGQIISSSTIFTVASSTTLIASTTQSSTPTQTASQTPEIVSNPITPISPTNSITTVEANNATTSITSTLPEIVIKTPQKNQTIKSSTLNVEIETFNIAATEVKFYLDRRLFATLNDSPYIVQKNLKDVSNGSHYLSVQACNKDNLCIKTGFDFNLSN